MKSNKPIILVPLDSENSGEYSKFPWYALRQHYCEAIVAGGGIPILLPHHSELIESYLVMADGILITGGAFDIDPSLFGDSSIHETVITKPSRTNFEWALTEQAYKRKLPILGICGGMQLLNVIRGGTLIQHIPDEISNPLAHEQPNPRTEPGHSIDIYPHTQLYRLVGSQVIPVNSAHHQAVKVVAPGMQINAVASDGVIEGIEDTSHPFCIGVQWHPEYHISEADKAIFKGFIAAARAMI